MKVFISSNYSGDEEANTHKHIEYANQVIDLGLIPFAPLLFHYVAITKHREYQIWLDLLMEWLKVCDVVLCTGSSSGCLAEQETAKKLGIPLVYSIQELEEYRKVHCTM